MKRYWPRQFSLLSESDQRALIEGYLHSIQSLPETVRSSAFEICKAMNLKNANEVRFQLYNYLTARLDQLPILPGPDQAQVEIVIDSLLPEDFDFENDCVKCLQDCRCSK